MSYSEVSRIIELQEEQAQTNIRLSNVEAKLDQVLQRLNPIQQVRLTALEGKLDRVLVHLSPIQQLRLSSLESKLDQVFRHIVRQSIDRVQYRRDSITDSICTEATTSTSRTIQQSSGQLSTGTNRTPIKSRTTCYDRSAVNQIKYEWLLNNQTNSSPVPTRLDSRPSTPIESSNIQAQEESQSGHNSMALYGSEISQPNSPSPSHGSRPSSSLSVQFCQKSSLNRNQTIHYGSSVQHGSGQGSPQTQEKAVHQFANIQTLSTYVKQKLDSRYLSGRDRQELRILLQLSNFENVLSNALRKDVLNRLQMFSAVVTHGWSAASRISARQSIILQDMTRRMQEIQVSRGSNRFKISRFHKLAPKSSRKKKA
ncbi:uncharacterized protein LOC118765331 [Octopus sinensis]|uniref:Uncharacterized protein LOC118765331 n=1 Tax=Octopus sinensis TaxID=2607531 RepID=A0A7E6F7T5_9MOLL|nr:uncharacterized protein LOC118765331 [Octopus sinensis]XP_036363027.1 uncharacterized protein LOC118765331 [Octopus sinensis]